MVNLKGFLISILLVIVSVIIIFSFVGTSSTTMRDSADAITDANNCSLGSDDAGSWTYDYTNKSCLNSTGDEQYTALQYDLPLNSLFGRSGVAFLIVMAALLLVIIGVVMRFKKQ